MIASVHKISKTKIVQYHTEGYENFTIGLTVSTL